VMSGFTTNMCLHNIKGPRSRGFRIENVWQYRRRGKFRWAKVSRLRLTKIIRGETFTVGFK